MTFHHWAFSEIAASCSLWYSSFHFAFFSMFWPVRDSFLPTACHKQTNYGLDLNKKNFLSTVNHFLIKTEQRTKYSNKMWSSIVTHPFTQDYHHHAGTYCGSHHHIAGFHSDSVSSSIDHLKPAENEPHVTNFNKVGFLCVPAHPWCTHLTWSLKSTAIAVWLSHTELWFTVWAQEGVQQHVCMTIRSFLLATDYVWSLTVNRLLVWMVVFCSITVP